MLKSQLFRGDAKLEAAAVSNPAHIVPGARGDHVRKIQLALKRLGNAGLDLDGSYGQGTANAVLAFKQKRGIINRSYQTEADNIVGTMTMVALDAEMAASEGSDEGVPFVSLSPGGVCLDKLAPAAKGGAGTSDLQPPDPATAAAVVPLVLKVRVVIRATRFKLTAAGPFVRANEKLTAPTGPFQAVERQSIKALINVFSLDKLTNPRPGFDNITRAFANMDVALNRSFETDPLIAPVLFVPNTHKSMEAKALAYTVVGGAFLPSKERIASLGVPANRIYVCNSLMKQFELEQTSALIHELAHFVSGRPLKISHDLGVPKVGLMLKDRTTFDRIAPEAKLRSAEHYAFFAMLAGFSRIVTL
jgi:peptidoglycan hydrolase-like protein with peptidoglycan-binding domain